MAAGICLSNFLEARAMSAAQVRDVPCSVTSIWFRRDRRAPLIPGHGLPMPYAFTAPSPEPRVVTFTGLLAARG